MALFGEIDHSLRILPVKCAAGLFQQGMFGDITRSDSKILELDPRSSEYRPT